MSRRLLLLGLLGACLAPPCARPAPAVVAVAASRASAAADTLLPKPALVDSTRVVATRLSRWERHLERSSFASIIDVAAERGPGEETADLLRRAAGVSVRRYGGPGAVAAVSIRGADPGEVEVFLDRVPLRTASRGFADLGGIDLAFVESVEVYRSAPPTDLGGEASGSAVRLVTRTGGGARLSAHLTAGRYGTRALEASAGGGLLRGAFFLSASRFKTEGNFTYYTDNGTDHETADDRWQEWSNGQVQRQTLFGRLTQTLPGEIALDWSSQFWRSDQGVPGTSRQPTRESRLEQKGTLHRLELSRKQRLLLPLEVSLYGYTSPEERHFSDPLRELGITGSPRKVDQEQSRNGAGIQMRGLWVPSAKLAGAHSLEVLAERRGETLRNLPSAGQPAEDRRERISWVVTAGDAWEIAGDRLHLDLFYRWDEARDNYTGANPWRRFESQAAHTSRAHGPRLGARLSLGRGQHLKANWTRQARFPTFVELFGYAGTIVGNPTLKPEGGERWDLGWVCADVRGPADLRITAELVYYESNLEEMIVFITVSNRETKPFNLDRAEIRGGEFKLALDPLPLLPASLWGRATAVGVTGHLTWQDARDLGASPIYNGKQLPYHPPLQSALQLDLAWGPWTLRYGARYRAAIYWARSNLPDYRSEPQWHHDLLARFRLASTRLVFSLRVDNLLDDRQEDIRGYPLPGRSWYGGVEMNLRRQSKP